MIEKTASIFRIVGLQNFAHAHALPRSTLTPESAR
jgi:hypothetical protein